MTEFVLDASVVVKWFGSRRERGSRPARTLRDEYTAGRVLVVVPALLFLELLNVAGRRWSWSEARLMDLATWLDALGFEIAEPPIGAVASWTARGLTAYDAAYVAVAEERGIRLITDDKMVLDLAPEIADPLRA